jgi:hypothetical protein
MPPAIGASLPCLAASSLPPQPQPATRLSHQRDNTGLAVRMRDGLVSLIDTGQPREAVLHHPPLPLTSRRTLASSLR